MHVNINSNSFKLNKINEVNSLNQEKGWAKRIAAECLDCGRCAESCRILTELNESPGQIARRGIEMDEAYGCALCGKCEAMCPLGLSPWRMFEQRRVEAVKQGEITIEEYQYLFPDRPDTVMSMFREYYGIDYSELNTSLPAQTGFLPGCTMLTYSPELTKRVYAALAKKYETVLFLDHCCGIPMYHIGLPERGDKIKGELREKARHLGVKRLITACPNCYYQFKKEAAFQDVEIITVYEALADEFIANQGSEVYAIHDSCPDRFEGIFGSQVREALDRGNYRRTEMKHHGKNSVCCGSSGQLGHFRPEWAAEHEVQNLEEAGKAGADTLLAYCHACVLNFGNIADHKSKVRHALNTLLGFEENYDEVKGKAAAMFEGEEGYERYLKLFQD
ncbi:heterodisulfide reductase-related iron-sulfur binding cluster [Desulfitobacterium chlororespirans]|uniref:heterodisulfide reductase-related iron-sulfur binding cluster n=1 Tax=Desulfitobacterium chlororespirans TaxID=51616 RepID=UPI0009332E1B